MYFRPHFGYDIKVASDEAASVPVGESLTVQSMKDDADLNLMIKRFHLTGQFPENPRVPQYGDFTGVGDYRTALEAIQRADEGFMEFPPEVRARFNNDPQALLEFVADGKNKDEALRIGLIKAPPVVEPPAIMKVEVVNPVVPPVK